MATHGPGQGGEAVPRLVGQLHTDAALLDAASVDFGRQTVRRPRAVFEPAHAADVAAMVRRGRATGVPVVVRGAGHTVDAQTLTAGGVVISLTALASVGSVISEPTSAAAGSAPPVSSVRVEAGARWRDVVAVTLPLGLAPPVLPDYLDLTVGGTIAAGGVGGASHRHGSVADNVIALDVVTPAGDLVTCSAGGLFDAVRGTQGAHGIITAATLTLHPVAAAVVRHRLAYPSLGPFLDDQHRLIAAPRFDHFVGQALWAGQGWSFVIDAAAADPAPLDDLAAAEVTTEKVSAAEFVHRLDPLVDQARATGSWQGDAHPRANVFLPGRHAAGVIGAVVRELTPADLGPGGSVLIYAIPTARLAAPRMPKADDPVTVVFGVQRTAPAGDRVALARMRRANAALQVTARRLGGASYSHPAAGRRVRRYPV
ncbi:FAD-binding protein [Asanoa siamensis]|uniref:FAD-binding PCMH-type domain-containing protein n=1 Tax=Asanoa siamensis TaxID=926357 RepID=A0ABQ4CLE6_9ACTN|nr:FAD-binding protein [Asanoa siamensis]GIF72090.1 hypothetical protein Asi02nite_16080 [Asanoa siamensis]